MATINAPFGFMPVRALFGGTERHRAIRGGIASGYSSNIFAGDPVKLVTSGTLQLAAPGDAITGFFKGWMPEDPGNWQVGSYWPASKTWTIPPLVYFIEAEAEEFVVQANGSLAQTSIGDSADYAAGTGNTKSGLSGAVLDTTLVGAGNTGQFKIVGLYEEVGNAWGDAYTKVRVKVNELNTGLVPGNAV